MVILSIITQTIAVLLLAALWMACLVGWGRALLRVAGFMPETLTERVTSFWMGLAGVVALMQGLAFGAPDHVDSHGSRPRVWLGISRNRRSISSCARRAFVPSLLPSMPASLSGRQTGRSAPLSFWIQASTTSPLCAGWRNIARYQGSAIWIPALASNQSYFLYAALLNSVPFKDWSFHFANATLVLAALVLPIRSLVAIVKREREAQPVVATFHLLCLVPYSLLIRSMYMSCPTPDLAIDVLEITTAGPPAGMDSRIA